MKEKAKVIVKEQIILEKFEGDALVERVYLTNGIIDKTEKFDKEEVHNGTN